VSGQPWAIDLYCGAGGAGEGLRRAGYRVLGVDVNPQPRYRAGEFLQMSVLDLTPSFLAAFDGIWASPPCQAHTSLKTMHNARPHLDLIPETRALLMASGRPWIMENVPGAPLINATRLCGTMFGLGFEDAELRRHRDFEASFPLVAPGLCKHGERDVIGIYGGHVRNRRRCRTIGIYGEGVRDSRRKFDKGVADFSIGAGRIAMDIDWMTVAELSQAIPPAYSEFLGRQMLALASE
jgi:DNA (cytosine-5)-methyltransferase 1